MLYHKGLVRISTTQERDENRKYTTENLKSRTSEKPPVLGVRTYIRNMSNRFFRGFRSTFFVYFRCQIDYGCVGCVQKPMDLINFP